MIAKEGRDMVWDQKVLVGKTADNEEIFLYPSMANRHGLIAGATGSGKTVSLKVLAEGFSSLGVSVFLSDVKGDLSGMMKAGTVTESVKNRIEAFGIPEPAFTDFPVTFWDVFGQTGIPLRTTISEMGPMLLARIMDLTDVQRDILTVVFKIADDRQLLLIDTKDLKAMLAYVSENNKEFEEDYGKLTGQSLSAITRAVVALEAQGADVFFGEPALSVTDWLGTAADGRGMMHVLDAASLVQNPRLYSTFLLWLLSELFEILPEVGDLQKPKMVFFFDEAHLLFAGAPKILVEKIEQLVKLVRSKGVGVFFCTQNPSDIPQGVLAQLGNKIQHAMHAYTPAEQKGVRAIAQSFPVNPSLKTYDVIMELGTGEAVVSFLNPQGVPSQAKQVCIMPPQSSMCAVDVESRKQRILESLLYSKYYAAVDPDSAYEFLKRHGEQLAAEKERLDREAGEEKEKAKRVREESRNAKKEIEKQERERKRVVKSVGNSVAGTVGRELGKQMGKGMGSFGKQLGGNLGASLGRGLLSTFLK